MTDIPDDLPSVGRHHGNDPPTDTGQEVRSPSGPDPDSTPADPAPALFQLVRDSDPDRVQIRVHSPRADVPPPEDGPEELGQFRTVESLREALAEADVDGSTAVFEDVKAGTVRTDTDVDPSHAWIGQPRHAPITFFADAEAADEYVSALDRPADPNG
jgi:hypothetical protein